MVAVFAFPAGTTASFCGCKLWFRAPSLCVSCIVILLHGETLISYQVRESSRAKRVSLRVLAPDGRVEVVLPSGHDGAASAAMMVELHRDWIVRQQRKLIAMGMEAQPPLSLPQQIDMLAISKTVIVEYAQRDGAALKLEMRAQEQDPQLVLSGDCRDLHAVALQLCAFLIAVAKQHLPAWIMRLAAQHSLQPNRITIRRQHTRWGSCSAKGNIALNAKLLLLPPPLVESVMLHELAHLRHLHHAPSYWGFLARMDADYSVHRVELRQKGHALPAWAEVRQTLS